MRPEDYSHYVARYSRYAALPRPEAPREVLPFGVDWVARFLPHYLTCRTSSQLHRDLYADLRDLHARRGEWRDYVAPRGSAKTSLATKAYALYCAVEGLEPYTLLLSDTNDQARTFLDAIKQELELNADLARAYPEACGPGPVWRASRVRLRNGCAIEVRGSGGRIRGLTNRNTRPTLVVVDDGNEKADAYSPTTRGHRWDWFTKDVMAVGSAATNYVVLGTPIHREAICHRLRTAPGWKARSYRSIVRYPERTDLWDAWARRLTNLADEYRDQTARAFYEAHRDDMDAGAEVLWAERMSLYDLMVYRESFGARALASEYQDEPGTDGASEWPSEYFDHTTGHPIWFEEWPDHLVYRVQSLDPSKGEGSRAGDYQAHVMLGLGREGHLYFDAEARREPSSEMIDRAAKLARAWRPQAIVVEDNGTMGLLRPEIERITARHGLMPWEMITNTGRKELRIYEVGKYLSTNRVRVRNTAGGRLLVEQWRDVPNGEFDDLPDAASVSLRRVELWCAVR